MAKWIAVLAICALPAPAYPAGAEPAPSVDPFAIENVTLLDGSGSPAREGATVIVRQGRIAAVLGTSAQLKPSLHRIDGKGGFLLPGFIDVHANLLVTRCAPGAGAAAPVDRKLSERMLGRLLDFGITSIRSPATTTVDGMALRDDLNAGRVRGPRAQASAQGVPVIGQRGATDWTKALDLRVDHLSQATDWSPAWLAADHREAYVAAVRARGALRARIDWLERVDPESSEVAAILARVAASEVSVDPTLVAFAGLSSGPAAARYRRNPYLHDLPELAADWLACSESTRGWTVADFARWRAAWPKMLALVAQMHRRGVLLTSGSDLGNPWVIPGEGLHQEFELLRQAGLPPLAILRATGVNAARALRQVDVGLVEAGRRADLVLLAADPRVDIGNTRRIVWTMKDGVIVSRGPALRRTTAPTRAGAELTRDPGNRPPANRKGNPPRG